MQVIAISYSGYDSVVGDMFIVGILTDESWFNTFRGYWNKNSMSIRLKRGVLFERLGDKLASHVVRRTKDNKTLAGLYMDVLNSFKEFWKHKIYMESPIGVDIIELMNKEIPNNLKNVIQNLYDCDIKFIPHRSLTLAWALAEEYRFQDEDLNKKIWGDFGQNQITDDKTIEFLKNRKDCTKIRDIYKNMFKEEENEKEQEEGTASV